MPDPTLTPGKLCTPSDPNFNTFKYPEHVAICNRNVSTAEKNAVAAAYGISTSDFSKFEFDHFLPLSAGGSDDITNIWPQPIAEAKEKDKLEQQVFDGMNAGTLTQTDAIAQIRAWRPATLPPGCHVGDAGTDGSADAGADGSGGDGGAAGGLASVKTVFVVVMENHNWSSIKGNASAPYINDTLLPMGAHAENYGNLPGVHPSEPNYLWLEAGDNFGIKNDNLPATNHQSTTDHLVTKLEAAGVTWKAYAEGASGTTCPVSNSGLYAPKHVPFVFFDDVRTNAMRCTQHVRPYTELASDLASGQVAQYNFITPDLCDDMHNSTGCATSDSLANGDTWLSHELPKIFASSAYQTGGAVFVTFDESEGGDLPIAMIVLSPFAKPGYSNSIAYSHSSTLRTVQEIFGVTPFLRDAAKATDLSDLFLAGGSSGGDAGIDSGTDAGVDAGGDSGGRSSCVHDVCKSGGKLAKTCDSCAQAVCTSDAFCCSSSWDSICVREVAQSGCGRTCP